jgi:hypothetical protein
MAAAPLAHPSGRVCVQTRAVAERIGNLEDVQRIKAPGLAPSSPFAAATRTHFSLRRSSGGTRTAIGGGRNHDRVPYWSELRGVPCDGRHQAYSSPRNGLLSATAKKVLSGARSSILTK